MKNIAIDARNICANLGDEPVLRSISLTLPRARWTAIVGPNGAGKSTLLRVLAGLLDCSGDVDVVGQSLSRLPAKRRAQLISWLGQSGSALTDGSADDMTVYSLAMLGRLPYIGWLAAPSDADHAAVRRALVRTHAWDWRQRSFGTLSGGERQRVLLARALAVEAEVLLMDEPLANLDPPHQADWLNLVRELVANGKTVVSVLHEMTFALMADDLVILADGRITHQGAAGDAATHRALEAVFDHRIAVHAMAQGWVVLPKLS